MKTLFTTSFLIILSFALNAQCPPTTAQTDLDVNNVRARLLNGGDLWWDPVAQVAHYEVPINSNKNSLYAGALWVGGVDNQGQLKLAVMTYRQGGANDYWAGPVSITSTSPSYGEVSVATCAAYDRFWEITRGEVLAFSQGGPATAAIQQWPGNGNVATGELPFLAPFFDANNDGLYNYIDGDYPYFNLSGLYPNDSLTGQPDCDNYLFGDKSIWWVFNDVGNIKSSGSANIGLEIRAHAFAYASSDADLNNATFYQYQIINRSSDSLAQTRFGMWCDPDLGNSSDDFVGCDVGLNMAYVYNGDSIDDGVNGYGLNPPACGIDFLRGPLADAMDGMDNDRDGVIDEPGEQILMSHFVYYDNINNTPTGNPATLDDYYEYLSGFWLDGQQITFGEGGRNPANPPANYMFSNGTDPEFPGQIWNMTTANFLPNDVRWVQSSGSFTMDPGEVNYFRTAVLWARDVTGLSGGSLSLLQTASQKIQALFDNCFTTTELAELDNSIPVQIAPNPFTTECMLDLSAISGKDFTIRVYDLNGKMIQQEEIQKSGNSYSIGREYNHGVYLIRITSDNKTFSGKIIKM
jgi:hypothetical protein